MRLIGAHELRQEREKEDRELRIEDVDQDSGDDHLRGRARADFFLHAQCATLPQRSPGHVSRYATPRYLRIWYASALVCRSAASPMIAPAMCGRCRAASEGGDRARPRSAREAGRQCEQDAGRRDDHDQRGQQKVDAHDASPRRLSFFPYSPAGTRCSSLLFRSSNHACAPKFNCSAHSRPGRWPSEHAPGSALSGPDRQGCLRPCVPLPKRDSSRRSLD